MPKEKLCQESDLADGEVKKFEVGERTLALVKIAGEFYCVDDVCTHGEFSLSEGDVDVGDCTLECPKHGSLFDLTNGEPLTLPATQPVQTYNIQVESGEVFVELC